MASETSDVCISVRALSKKFARSLRRSLIYGAVDIGRELLGLEPKNTVLRESEFWALKDISFNVYRGRSMGIVGPNGSGKTTLLRIITGILKPSEGEALIWGRIAPLLALGAGFKPVLSGRENVFTNMALLGVPFNTIKRRFDEVVDFAELWEAIDAPVGTYSSGMMARLGFSCAIHTDPEILIVDEILAVGDARFRMKCRNRINDLRRRGTTFLIVSHSPISLLTLSDECLLLQQGRVVAQGEPQEILKRYEIESARADAAVTAERLKHNVRKPKVGDRIAIEELSLFSAEPVLEGCWMSGKEGFLKISLVTKLASDEVSINMIIASCSGSSENLLFIQSCKDVGWFNMSPGQATITLSFPSVTLSPGSYIMKLNVSTGSMFDVQDALEGLRFSVADPGNMSQCRLYQPRIWRWNGLDVTTPPQPEHSETLLEYDDV